MTELPEIWLDLSSFIEDKKSSEFEAKIDKKFPYREERFRLSRPFQGKIKIQKTYLKRNLVAHFDIKITVNFRCDRCLARFDRKIRLKFSRLIKPEANDEEIELSSNNQVEVFEPIWQELILHIPPRILCRPDCKGICPICGTNWNEKSCPHQKEVMMQEEKRPTPLAQIKEMWQKKQK